MPKPALCDIQSVQTVEFKSLPDWLKRILINLKCMAHKFSIDRNKILHGIVVQIDSIPNFEDKLDRAITDNWKINGILQYQANYKFENLNEFQQKMFVDYIRKMS